MNYTKNTKLIILGIVSVIIIAVTLIFSESTTKITSQDSDLIDFERKIDNLQKDSDGDGLRDWEEELLGLDPFNPDTDGDGIGDKEELESGEFDYTKLNETSIISGGDIFGIDSNNLTESVAKELFIKYLFIDQGGVSTEENSDFINTLLGGVNVFQGDTYTISDLNIKTDSSNESLHEYGNDLMRLILSYAKRDESDLLVLFQDVISKKDSFSIQRLNNLSRLYKELALELILLGTPKSVGSFHLKIINTNNNIGTSLFGMSKVNEDALTAMLSFAEYQRNIETGIQTFIELSIFFKNKNVLFKEGENGSLLEKYN